MVYWCHFCWVLLAQTQPAASGTTPAPAEPTGPFGMGFMFPALMAVMVLYFMLMTKPQPKATTKTSELLSNLKKNDRVVTAGGILGTVVNFRADDEFVTLRIDDSSNARMQVLATSIVRVVTESDTKS